MIKCAYCGKPFDPDSDWHKNHPNLGRCCSHGCLYAEELPLSHGGQTFVSVDECGEIADESAEQPGTTAEVKDMGGMFATVIKLLARLDSIDRDLLLFRMRNGHLGLKTFAARRGFTVQAVHRRLSKLCDMHPAIEAAVSEHRYRKH